MKSIDDEVDTEETKAEAKEKAAEAKDAAPLKTTLPEDGMVARRG